MPAIDELLGRPFAWPDLGGVKVLVLGIGGGADALTAWALARYLGPQVAWGNTKHALDADLLRVSGLVGRLPDGAAPKGTTTTIERALPPGPEGSPFVLASPRGAATEPLAGELKSLGFERLIAVDTGGDALDSTPRGRKGRDRRMVEVLRATGLPAVLAVVAPGADGQLTRERLEDELAAAADRCLGAFSLEPLLADLRAHSTGLAEHRTPRIISAAFAQPDDPVEVPRGCRPRIPRAWLTTGLVFEV